MVSPLWYTRKTFSCSRCVCIFCQMAAGRRTVARVGVVFLLSSGLRADTSIHRSHCCSVLMGPNDDPGDFFYHPLWSLPVPRRARALPVCDVYSQNAFKALLWTSQQYLKHQHVILPSLTFLAAILDLVLVFWTKMLFSFSQVLVTSSWDNFSPVLVDENRF